MPGRMSVQMQGRMTRRLCRLICGILMVFAVLTAVRMTAHAAIRFDRACVNVMKGKTRDLDISCSSKNYKVYSSNRSIAQVNHKGRVKGKKAGDCEIIVTCGNETASIPVHVMSSITSGEMTFIGHRGYQDKYPENTISAFRGALRYGAAGVEFDVWVTRSKDLLVFHDESLKRMCGKSGSIRNVSASSRKKYKVRHNGRTGKIPTLEESIRFLSNEGKIAFIHMKKATRMVGKPGDEIADCIRRYGMLERSVVFCSSLKVIGWFSEHHPDVQVGYLYLGSSSKGAASKIRGAYGRGAKYFYFFSPSAVSYSNIRLAHRLGMKAGLYKTTQKKQILKLMDYGADFAMLYHKLIKK